MGLHPRYAQGQGQGRRSRATGTSVMSRNVYYIAPSDVLSLHALTLRSTVIRSPSSTSVRQLDVMSTSWNELLRHWRSGYLMKLWSFMNLTVYEPPGMYSTSVRRVDGRRTVTSGRSVANCSLNCGATYKTQQTTTTMDRLPSTSGSVQSDSVTSSFVFVCIASG